MAAFLDIAPAYGAPTAGETIARLSNAVAETLRRQAGARATLACCWTQDAEGRLVCHWEIDVPTDNA